MKVIKNKVLIYVSCFLLFGCTIRTYRLNRERVDQDIIGNRGYIYGNPPSSVVEKKPTRTIQQVEIELHMPIRFERLTSKKQNYFKKEDKELWGNLGYIEKKSPVPISKEGALGQLKMERYTVQNGDTLQKISQKFYGTVHLWPRIYEANRDIITEPNKIYPGQILNIPLEEKKESSPELR